PHYRLFMPTIGKGPYSYEFINVEDAEQDSHSLLNFTKRLLALRKQHTKVFGRGSFDSIPVENQRVLAFVREHEETKILVVANLSRFTQSVHLPVSDLYRGLTPVELFSQSAFPAFSDEPYHMLLAPHGFLWFALEPEEVIQKKRTEEWSTAPALADRELPLLKVPEGIENLLIKTLVQERGMERLQELLPAFLQDQRWFGSREEQVQSVTISDAVRLQAKPRPAYLSILEVALENRSEIYSLPLYVTPEEEAAEILETQEAAAIAWVDTPAGRGLLHDATVHPEFWLTLFRWWQTGGKGRSLKGLYVTAMDRKIQREPVHSARRLSGEQSNSAAIVDDRFFVKLYRRLERGTNPETEMLDYLTSTGFQFIPSLHGKLSFNRPGEHFALGVVQEALSVEQDGWDYALDIMGRFLDRVTELAPPEEELPLSIDDAVPTRLEEVAPEALSLARVLGIRTAELHLSLARAQEPDLHPVPGAEDGLTSLIGRVRAEAARTRQMLNQHAPDMKTPAALWESGLRRLNEIEQSSPPRQLIRIHGDYHLGQVILADGEFYILDFEGEPARSLQERRQRDHAIRDVAGMLRSLEYAALVTWKNREVDHPELRAWTEYLVGWLESIFLNAYFSASEDAPFVQPASTRSDLLWTYLFDKALYEIRYEINHRPSWVWLPMHGLTRLLENPDRFSVSFDDAIGDTPEHKRPERHQ
ncbi:MAG: alpha-glucosidase C-terminal domain-containing protein, partial [Rhodothermales bacterium]